MEELTIINAYLLLDDGITSEPGYLTIADGFITDIGSMLQCQKTGKVIDGRGGLLLPGFTDAHTHLVQGGLFSGKRDFSDCRSREDFIRRVKEGCAGLGRGEWFVGMGYDETHWGGESPHQDWINAVSKTNPVIIIRHDGHIGLANAKALELAGYTSEHHEEKGGEIFRNREGYPTGLLKDAALYKLLALRPPLTYSEFQSALKEGARLALRLGVTTVSEMGDIGDQYLWKYYLRAAREERFPIRMVYYLEYSGYDEEKLQKLKAGSGERFRFGGIKIFLDGSLGARTARFFRPYLDTNGRGLFSQLVEEKGKSLLQELAELDKRKLQLAIHAIGDEAVALFSEIALYFRANNPPWDRRLRCEHFQHIPPDIWERLPKESVVLSVQPYHAVDDFRWIARVRPRDELRFAFPLRSIIRHGYHLALGTDFPVAPLNPLETVKAAVQRGLEIGETSKLLPEALSVEAVLQAYTTGSAFALKLENLVGKLEIGKAADLVLLADEVWKSEFDYCDPAGIKLTLLEGEVVYCHPEFDGYC